MECANCGNWFELETGIRVNYYPETLVDPTCGDDVCSSECAAALDPDWGVDIGPQVC